MDELNPSRMQMNGCVVIGSPGSVFDVTFDGAAETGQCGANLMVTTCFWLHLHEGVVVRAPHRPIGQFRLFFIGSIKIRSKALVGFDVFLKKIDNVTFRWARPRSGNGPIGFFAYPASETCC